MVINQDVNEKHALYNGDCVEVAESIPENSIHLSVTSIPFAALYVYSNSERDLGNSRTYEEFRRHFGFMVNQWFRVMMPGRIVAIHCFQIPRMKERDGFIGVRDFRGDVVRVMEEHGFIYHSEICIWKCPVVQMQRTKALGLLHKQVKKDSAMCRQGLADYLVMFRKPGDNPERCIHTNESFPVQMWQRYASPVWAVVNEDNKDGFYNLSQDINPSDTLQRESARDVDDERHIAPLQLEVIRRAVNLWSNENDIVYDPFGGIGSTGVEAIKLNRKTIMSELKGSYYKQMVLNVTAAERQHQTETLFGWVSAKESIL